MRDEHEAERHAQHRVTGALRIERDTWVVSLQEDRLDVSERTDHSAVSIGNPFLTQASKPPSISTTGMPAEANSTAAAAASLQVWL